MERFRALKEPQSVWYSIEWYYVVDVDTRVDVIPSDELNISIKNMCRSAVKNIIHANTAHTCVAAHASARPYITLCWSPFFFQ